MYDKIHYKLKKKIPVKKKKKSVSMNILTHAFDRPTYTFLLDNISRVGIAG